MQGSKCTDTLIVGYKNGNIRIMDQSIGNRLERFDIENKIMCSDLNNDYIVIGSTKKLSVFKNHLSDDYCELCTIDGRHKEVLSRVICFQK